MEEKELRAFMEKTEADLKQANANLKQMTERVEELSKPPEKKLPGSPKSMTSHQWFENFWEKHVPVCKDCQDRVIKEGKKLGEAKSGGTGSGEGGVGEGGSGTEEAGHEAERERIYG